MAKKCVYLDYNGTTPIYPSVLDAMLPYFNEHFGNPSSSHHFGQEPKRAVNKARRSLLGLIRHIRPNSDDKDDDDDASSSIVFTGCGTESNNLAIRLSLLSSLHKADENNGLLHVVTTNIEHPAITQCLNSYSDRGGLTPKISVTYVAVNKEGIVSTEDIINAIRPNTALVTIMTANNEVGSIQPVFEIAKICRERGILIHTDAAQAVGKIDLRGLADATIGADMVTIVGHKFGAPKGIAALYIRPNCFGENGRTNPEEGGSVLLMGGGQEGGRRGGTENVPYIAGMGRAAEMLFDKTLGQDGCVRDGWEHNSKHMSAMRQRLLRNLIQGLEPKFDGESQQSQQRLSNLFLGLKQVKAGESAMVIVRTNGPSDQKKRLPNTLSVGLKGVRSGELLAAIGNIVACSAGSACHSSSCSSQTISYSSILKAMDVPPEYAIGTLRLSVGPDTTQEEVDLAAEVIVKEAKRQLGL